MRTAFLISSLNSGGAERVVTILANELALSRKIIIITLSKDEPFYKLNDAVTLKQLGVLNTSKNPLRAILSNFILIYKITSLIRSLEIKHLICFMTTSNVLGIISGKFFSKIRVTISERRNPLTHDFGFWDKLRIIFYKYSDKLVLQTEEIKCYFKQFVSGKKIKIISNPIKVITNNKFKKEKIILTVGKLNRNKNQQQILRSFSRIKSDGWKLVLCGEGPLIKELKSLTLKLKIDKKVEFTGTVKNIEHYYERASVFAFSSISEGFPNVLLEAMNHECACISTDCFTDPGILIKHNKNGFLIPLAETSLYDKHLQILIDDEKLRSDFAYSGKRNLQNYSLKTIVKKWIV